MAKAPFEKHYTSLQREIIDRLAEIEQEDEDRCAHCGGEDCCCCEYYLDRQKWVEPEELFSEDYDDPFYGWHDEDNYLDEEDDEE